MDIAEAAPTALGAQDANIAARRGLDGWSLALWSLAVLVAAMALPAANWTDALGYVPVVAAAGLVLGTALVLSRFRAATALVLGLGYGLLLILWQLTAALDPAMPWRERALDLFARVAAFVSIVLAGEPSYDSLMFVLAMSLTFWAIAVFGSWWLFRRGGLWLAVLLPGIAVFLNVYYYRYGTRLQLYLPVFLLVALALIVRTELVRRRGDWEQRRAQVSIDVSSRVTQAGIVAALVLVAAAWMGPRLPDTQLEAAGAVTGSRSPFDDILADALAGLRSPVNLYGEAFASTLALGAGRPPGDHLVFQARSLGELPAGSRVYWRARAYDTYRDHAWQVTLGDQAAFRPSQEAAAEAGHAGRVEIEFAASTFMPAMKLLYLPAEVAWINRSADLLEVTEAGSVVDVLEATSSETLFPGDSYRVRSRLAAPSAGDLRRAGASYPAWIMQSYLQIPDGFPPRVGRLAREIAGQAPTPYDKVERITAWLRANMNYERESAAPPAGREPVDWFLFDSRLGFCDYYASAAVLMLRSLGVPSRLAAGFASGTYDPDTQTYLVSEADVHSWPEVYFPEYGWVEFEPTVSQPPLDRPQGEGPAGTPGEGAADDAAAGLGFLGGNLPPDRLEQFADIEDIQIPEPSTPQTPWLAYGLLVTAILFLVVYITPGRRVVARLAVAGARRTGRRAPARVEAWASPPLTEAAAVFQRLARWPGRLGVRLDQDATPRERALAVAREIPEETETIAMISDAYNRERYGGLPPVRGQTTRAWRSLRLSLYRAALTRLVSALLPANRD